MPNKAEALGMLQDEFQQWRNHLDNIEASKFVDPNVYGQWSAKDVVAHLWSWQQLSIARMEAGLENRLPEFTLWSDDFEPENPEDVQKINSLMYEKFRDKSWADVYQDWQQGFQQFIELAEKVPEVDLLNPEKYEWLNGYALVDVLLGSYWHHREDHREPLLEWFKENEK